MTEQQNQHEPGDVGKKAEEIASEAENVRERTRELFVNLVHERNLDLGQVTDVAEQIVDGAIQGVRDAAPAEQESVLRKVVDGVSDGFSSTANATRLALQEAKSRGESFAKEDVGKALEDLQAMERLFIDSVTRTFTRASETLSAQVSDLNEHVQRAASDLRPNVQSAIETATQHPVQLAGEAARASVEAVPRAAGSLLSTVGGLLQGAGDALLSRPEKKKQEGEGESSE